MGNAEDCVEGCFSWIRREGASVKILKRIFRKSYKTSIFYANCKVFVREMHLRGQTQSEQNDVIQRLKGSLLDSGHHSLYQSPTLPNEDSESSPIQYGSVFNTISMNERQTQEYIVGLIKRSHILLDISDIFQQKQHSEMYQKQIKRVIFEDESSIMSESFVSHDILIQSLKKLQNQTITKLECYVKLCEKIKQSFDPDSGSLLYHFLLNLKATLIQNYKATNQIAQLFRNTKDLISILVITINIFFKLPRHLIQDKVSQDSRSFLSELNQQAPINQNKSQIQFFNSVNLQTFATCILFENPEINQFLRDSILSKYDRKLRNFRLQNTVSDQMMVESVLDQQMEQLFRPTVSTLFSSSRISQRNYFQKTVKIFRKLNQKNQPVLKLKIIGQVQKQFLKDLNQLAKQKNKQIVYNRQIAQKMAKWLLSRDKQRDINSIPSIIIAYVFVHQNYRCLAKGSSLTSFLQVVQGILNTNIPLQ